MDSCPGLAIFTFLSLLFNTAFAIRWYVNRKRNTPMLQYQASLVENIDTNSPVVSL